jgi:alpha-ketoglutarate-dependent taurine dioxygenase
MLASDCRSDEPQGDAMPEIPLIITRLSGALGAEVAGVDLRDPSDDATAAVRSALVAHQVLVFRDQPLTPTELKSFFTRFGALDNGVIRSRTMCETEPDVLVLETLNPGTAAMWHTDSTYQAEPPMAACLHAKVLPSVGGDTCFASMFAAYESLSAQMKGMLDGLHAVHDTEHLVRRFRLEDRNVQSETRLDYCAIHPLVRTHPESGRKSLFYSSGALNRIVELTEVESDAIIAFLHEHVSQPRFQLRVCWAPETLVIWDERSTVHAAVADYDEPRVMHRLMLRGHRPFNQPS